MSTLVWCLPGKIFSALPVPQTKFEGIESDYLGQLIGNQFWSSVVALSKMMGEVVR